MEMYLSDGTTFVTLASGTSDAIAIEKYVPKPPTGKDTIAESCQILIEGKDLAKSTARDLGRLFVQTARYQQGRIGSRVYVHFRPDDWEEWQRSEILAGRLEWDAKALDEQWAAGLIEAAVIWERKPYWEGEEQELQLANPSTNDAPTLGGITLHNPADNDALALGDPPIRNYADIAGLDVAGDLPAPIRLELLNTYNDASRAGTFWISQNLLSGPSTWEHILEAEEATTTGTVVTGDTTSSQEERVDFDLATADETTMLAWTLSAAQLTAAAGNWFRALLKFGEAANTANITEAKYRLRIKSGTTTLWQSEQISHSVAGSVLRDLGILQLPPGGLGLGAAAALTLELAAQRVGGAITLSLDYLQLTPVDAWIEIRGDTAGIAYNGRLVVDGIENLIYEDTGDGTARKPGWFALGSPWPVVTPGEATRIYLAVHSANANVARVERTHEARAYYRPRRATLG